MGYHPNDPPISPYRKSAQIMVSADAYRRLINIAPSPSNGVTFCQGNFKAMGEDIYSVAREFTEQGKVHFIHYRDVEGHRRDAVYRNLSRRTVPTDMARMLENYSRAGFRRPHPSRPTRRRWGPRTRRRPVATACWEKIFAFGYMIGMMQAQKPSLRMRRSHG